MAVKIGSARINELGTVSGGKAGDQTDKECSTQDWYLSNKGWVVIAPVDPIVAEKIAKDMEYICDGNVGYCQAHRTDLYEKSKAYGFDVSKVTVPTETDCSDAVRTCLAYAGIVLPAFTTANEAMLINTTGKFDILTSACYCKKSEMLKRGMILVTKTKGHTVVVLSNGSKADRHTFPQLQMGDKGYHTKLLQSKLKNKGYFNNCISGDYDIMTYNAVLAFQASSEGKLIKDGICGNNTWSALMN